MKRPEVEKLAKRGTWKGKPINGEIIETHAAWVIMGEEFVFKIKKPVKFSFLDFSTTEKRRHFCERELQLNRRITNIYLAVLPVSLSGNGFAIGHEKGDIVDFAVLMKKTPSRFEMNKVLKTGAVSPFHLQKLAKKLAAFHTSAEVIRKDFDLNKMRENFNDLALIRKRAERNFGRNIAGVIDEAIRYSDDFTAKHEALFKERVRHNFRRDLHGDLHSGNVFLTEDPIIFDCLEFDDEMRHLDILDEVAFLCMDLDVNGKKDLSQKFLELYLKSINLHLSGREPELFHYFKCYRANVRAKVNLLQRKPQEESALDYLKLLKEYLELG